MLVAAGIARPRDAGGFCPKTIVSLPFGVQNPTPASAGGIVPTLYSPLLLAASALIVPRLRQLPLCSRPKPPPQYSHRTKTTVEDNQPSPNTHLVVFPLPTTLPKMSIHLIVFPGHFPTPSIAREHPGWRPRPAPTRPQQPAPLPHALHQGDALTIPAPDAQLLLETNLAHSTGSPSAPTTSLRHPSTHPGEPAAYQLPYRTLCRVNGRTSRPRRLGLMRAVRPTYREMARLPPPTTPAVHSIARPAPSVLLWHSLSSTAMVFPGMPPDAAPIPAH